MGASLSNPRPKRRVLIIDDDPGIAKFLHVALSSEGFHPQTASSANEGLEILSRDSFDAIISDLHMPGISGMDLLAQVREKYPHVPFLMATGEADARIGIEAMKHGAVDYLIKPFQPSTVLASLSRALHIGQMERELEDYRRN